MMRFFRDSAFQVVSDRQRANTHAENCGAAMICERSIESYAAAVFSFAAEIFCSGDDP
jgi:hypothetical protein